MKPSYWLLKTEPETYSFEQLMDDRKTNWNGVRNFQARNYLRKIKRDDLALIYHSGKEKAVIGVARVTREAYPDLDPETPGDWVQVDIVPIAPLSRTIPLLEVKATRSLQSLPLIKQSRLSVMPITAEHYKTILELSKKK